MISLQLGTIPDGAVTSPTYDVTMFDKSIKRSEKLARSNDNVGFAEGNVPRIGETRISQREVRSVDDAGKLPESGRS